MELPYPGMRGPGYSHGSMSIEAAIRGAGVALGRSVLVAEDLAADRLVSLFPDIALEVEWVTICCTASAIKTNQRSAPFGTGC